MDSLTQARATDGCNCSWLPTDQPCVFGKVISGKEVVDAIAQVSTGNKDRHQNVPVSPITIQSARRTAGG